MSGCGVDVTVWSYGYEPGVWVCVRLFMVVPSGVSECLCIREKRVKLTVNIL